MQRNDVIQVDSNTLTLTVLWTSEMSKQSMRANIERRYSLCTFVVYMYMYNNMYTMTIMCMHISEVSIS